MITIVSATNDRTAVMIFEPCEIVLHMEHMLTKLAHCEQSINRVMAHRAEWIDYSIFYWRNQLLCRGVSDYRLSRTKSLSIEGR